jgi:hypothetical protein
VSRKLFQCQSEFNLTLILLVDRVGVAHDFS